MPDEPKTVELTLVNDTAVVAPQAAIEPPADDPSLVRRYVKARRTSHASSPSELVTYIEYHFIDLIEQPGASAEQQVACLRELGRLPKVLNQRVSVNRTEPAVWSPAAETLDVLERV